MNAQNEVTLSFVESFESYVTDSKSMGELKARLEDARKVLEPVIRAHKIPVEPKADNFKAWKEKRPVFFPLVQELEWPRDDDGNKIEKDDISETEIKRMDARVVAWLGVIKTCLELQILPTDKNADRLRKARTWTALSGNGKPNPNWVDPNAPKIEEPASAPATVPVQTDLAPLNALALATMQPGSNVTTATEQTAPAPAPAPTSKPATPQKTETAIAPLHSNVSSSEAPISAREHCTILFDQLFKNEAFRSEFAPILAMCLDSNVATVTRCLVEARDAMLNGKGVK